MKERPLKIPHIFCNNIYFSRPYIFKMLDLHLQTKNIYIYIYIYIYIQSASKDNGCGLFVYGMYEKFQINPWECLMNGYCYIFSIQDDMKSIMIFFAEINL